MKNSGRAWNSAVRGSVMRAMRERVVKMRVESRTVSLLAEICAKAAKVMMGETVLGV